MPLEEHSNTGLIHATASLTTRLAAVQFSPPQAFFNLEWPSLLGLFDFARKPGITTANNSKFLPSREGKRVGLAATAQHPASRPKRGSG
jgi:hypothetical protein